MEQILLGMDGDNRLGLRQNLGSYIKAHSPDTPSWSHIALHNAPVRSVVKVSCM